MGEERRSFKGNELKVKQHICDPESINSFDKRLLEQEKIIWVGSLKVT
jgi:hypothetical protein